jgi:hypothetical protein
MVTLTTFFFSICAVAIVFLVLGIILGSVVQKHLSDDRFEEELETANKKMMTLKQFIYRRKNNIKQ